MKWEHTSNALGYQVNKANAALRSSFQQTLRNAGFDLTPEQWGTLHFLTSNSGISLSDLAKITHKDKTSVTRLINGMVKKDLINRDDDPRDRRIYRISLSKDGESIYNNLKYAVKQYNNKLTSIISQEDAELLVEGLSKLTAELNSEQN